MPKPRLHLDADTSNKALYKTLLGQRHDVTRTPNEWISIDASDEDQLIGATTHGRCIFAVNARDFIPLTRKYPQHGGVILAAQKWPLSALIAALDLLLAETDAEDWPGELRWLNEWMVTFHGGTPTNPR
jgi:hypothetical protein